VEPAVGSSVVAEVPVVEVSVEVSPEESLSDPADAEASVSEPPGSVSPSEELPLAVTAGSEPSLESQARAGRTHTRARDFQRITSATCCWVKARRYRGRKDEEVASDSYEANYRPSTGADIAGNVT
jgi:hypothetical protein